VILRLDPDTDIWLADADAVAKLYRVSVRTVRRRCEPVQRFPPAGQGSVQALYDAIRAADDLKGVAARPERTAAALRARKAAGKH
jgi:hypothetical protein